MIEKGLKIFHVNTRSIMNKISKIQTLYANVDILCCTETWLDNRASDNLVKLQDKTIFRCDRYDTITDFRKNVFGGGVCIFVAKPFDSYSKKIPQYTQRFAKILR